MPLVRPIEVVELSYHHKTYTFYPQIWYVCYVIREGSIIPEKLENVPDPMPEDRFVIELPGENWPDNTIKIYRNAFERIFTTKEEHRDNQINDILGN